MVVEIHDRGSLGKAALALRVSQPTLSKTLARLEDELGQRLFERGRGGSAAPTIFARHIVENGRAILAATESLERDIRLLAGGELGRIRIGVGPGVKAFFLPDLINGIVDRFPHLRLDVDVLPSDELYDRLSAGKLDIVLGHFSPFLELGGLVKTDLFEEPAVSVARHDHPLAARHNLTWEDALAYPHVSTVKFKTYANVIAKEGIGPEAEQILTAVRTSDMESARLLVSRGDFIALGSAFIFLDELRSGAFVTLDLAHSYVSACSVLTTQEAAHFPVVGEIKRIAMQASRQVKDSMADIPGCQGGRPN